MVRLYASRTDPHDASDPALSAYQSAKQALVANIARGRSWTGMTVSEERSGEDWNRTTYRKGGATALYLDNAGTSEPVATATVNVPGASEALDPEEVLVKDYAENEAF